GKSVEFGAALGFVEASLGGVEEYFRLEHEAVADDANVGPIAEDGAQPAEEVGTIAREFLYALSERHVEPLAEIGDPVLRFLVSLLAGVERLLQRGELASQRRDLLVEHFDLCQRARADPLLRVKLAAERGLPLGVAADTVVEALVAVTLALGRRQARLQHRDSLLEAELAV